MFPMTNSHPTDDRLIDYTNPPVQFKQIDQMGQWIIKSEICQWEQITGMETRSTQSVL